MNQYLVLVLDALLHLGALFLMGFLVSFIVKIFSRAHVDFRLIGGLFIIFVLTVVKMFLERRIGGFLPGVTPDLLFGLMTAVVLITTIFLVYWQYSVPLAGATCSAIVVVVMLFAVAYGVPKLSLKWMPEGQRFAEYSGFASEQTAQLMELAKNYEKRVGGPTIWQKAWTAMTFFTTDQEELSRDFAAGIEVYKERKALMDSMTDEELADYRQAMADFLQEQGLAENRYSLSALKQVQPEDLANLGSFMKELNGEFGIEETNTDESIPESADSIRQISQHLKSSHLSGRDREIYSRLIQLVGSGDLKEGVDKARAELAALKQQGPLGAKLFSNARSLEFSNNNSAVSFQAEERIDFQDKRGHLLTIVTDERRLVDFETRDRTIIEEMNEAIALLKDRSQFSAEKIGVWVLQFPPDLTEKDDWKAAALAIPYRAWFAGQGTKAVSKLILEDIVVNAGDSWQFRHNNGIYVFQFDKVTDEGVFIAAIKKL